MKAAHSHECAAFNFLLPILWNDGDVSLWARPLEVLFL